MADRMLFIGWDQPARGREERAVECFNESVGYYGRCQQEGKIESFDITLLTPVANGLDGYIELHGTAEQLFRLQEEPEFQRLLTEASVCVDGMRCVMGWTNEAIARQMEVYGEAAATVNA